MATTESTRVNAFTIGIIIVIGLIGLAVSLIDHEPTSSGTATEPDPATGASQYA